MYILGLTGKPDTFRAIKDSPLVFAKEHKDLAKANPGTLIFSLYLPGIDHVYIVGIRGKLDTACFFTTYEEMNAQRTKYGRFYSVREVYHLELKTFGGSTEEAPHPRPAA